MKKIPLIIRKSINYAFVIVTGINTIVGLWGYTVRDISDKLQWWQCGIIMLVAFAILSTIMFVILSIQKHKTYDTTINGVPVKIKVGDIFDEKGLKVIPFKILNDTPKSNFNIVVTNNRSTPNSKNNSIPTIVTKLIIVAIKKL